MWHPMMRRQSTGVHDKHSHRKKACLNNIHLTRHMTHPRASELARTLATVQLRSNARLKQSRRQQFNTRAPGPRRKSATKLTLPHPHTSTRFPSHIPRNLSRNPSQLSQGRATHQGGNSIGRRYWWSFLQ